MIFFREELSELRILEIRSLYESSFPENERMPFERILKKREDGVMRLISIEDESGALIGFANITLCLDALALNYLAIDEKERGKGYGTAVISELKARYPERSIVIDIEDDGVPADNTEQRIRRRTFYEGLGFFAMPYRLDIFGVPSIIMSSGRSYSFEEYIEIFTHVFSAWGAQRVVLRK